MPTMAPAELQQLAIHRAGSAGWRAALHIILSPAFDGDGRVYRHVGPDCIDFESMLSASNNTFSGGEERLLRVAWSLYGTGDDVSLNGMFSWLSDEWVAIALEAIARFRGDTLADYV